MTLSEELQARGFIHQFTADSLATVLDGEKRVVYHGIDPTADSAHAGNFAVWLLLMHLAKAGHKVIFLIGGGTGMIGDPKPDVERPLTPPEEVAVRVEKLRAQATRLFGENADIEFVNNHNWLSKLDLIGFLRDTGKHFTVNELIKKDAIATRLGGQEGISYTEFAYPLLQAYDYYELNRTYGCDLQVGGSDQWGNIVAGVDLIRRKTGNTVHALTVPLVIDKTTGKKFGKSEGNAIWLDAEKTSPYHFYQFWLNVSDENVIDYLKLFTFLSLEEIAALESGHQAEPGKRLAQRTLAHSVVRFVHGEAVAQSVERVSEVLFGDAPLSSLNEEEQQVLVDNAPVFKLASGIALADALVAAELATSKREARTFIESGAVAVNGGTTSDTEMLLSSDVHGPLVLLRRGKKNRAVVKFE